MVNKVLTDQEIIGIDKIGLIDRIRIGVNNQIELIRIDREDLTVQFVIRVPTLKINVGKI